jgi:hypothetical protein
MHLVGCLYEGNTYLFEGSVGIPSRPYGTFKLEAWWDMGSGLCEYIAEEVS